MSIRFRHDVCVACEKCCHICPGDLISWNTKDKILEEGKEKGHGRPCILEVEECWGCAACMKECPVGAIEYFLEMDIQGMDGYMTVEDKKEALHWHIYDNKENKTTIITRWDKSNAY